MIPVIDLNSSYANQHIEDAYTSVGFAVFTNSLTQIEKSDIISWFSEMKAFFNLPDEIKKKYPYEGDTNLGYSMVGDENVDPTRS